MPPNSAITPPSYIFRLAYYANPTVFCHDRNNSKQQSLGYNIAEAYSPGFRKHFDANVNIIGSVLNHVRTIKSTLTKGHFIFSQIQ